MLSQAEETDLVGEDIQTREDLRKELFDDGKHLQTILEEGYKTFPEVKREGPAREKGSPCLGRN